MTDFNLAPYYDDFDEKDKYYKVLFRPGVAVQTRELNQLQSILQNQITKFGNHVFRDGSMVIPGQVNYNDKLNYLKVSSVSLGSEDLTYLEDKIISSESDGTGVRAQVVKTIAATDTTPITLVLLYIGGNETSDGLSTGKLFEQNTNIYVVEDNTKIITVSGGTGISGRSVAAGIQDGVYYLGGYFVTIEAAVISVKTYADDVTDINARVGIQYTTEFITADADTNLNDNAAGTPNYAAPGAHRYKINTEFVQVGLDENPENFFELLRVEDGVLQSIINASQYNILEETLARRTYEESGNYVVEDFRFDVRESRTNDRGNWSPGSYLVNDFVASTGGKYFVCVQAGTTASSEPSNFDAASTDESVVITDGSVKWRYTLYPQGNNGYTLTGSSSNLVATFGLGKAYVQGYEIAKVANSNIILPKARDTRSQNNTTLFTPVGNYVYTDKRYTWGVPNISVQPNALLFDRTVGSRSAETNKFGHGVQVGTARLVWSEPDARGGVRLGLSEIKMTTDKSFDRDANSIIVPSATTSIAQTSYAITGLVRYAGNNTSSYLQISGGLGSSSQGSTAMIVSGLATLYTQELILGDRFTVGTSSHATTSTWTVTQVISDSTIVVNGSPFAAVGTAGGTSIHILCGKQTILGLQTGTATQLQAECRVGDTIYIGTAANTTTGIVLGFATQNRMFVSSVFTTIIASTAIGQYYAGQVADFAADAWSNFALGINARKLTGTFTLLSYTGTAVTIGTHQAIKITGSGDAKLKSELVTNDLLEVNGNRIFITKVSSNTVAFGVNIDSTTAGSTTDYPAFRINNTLNESSSNSLVFPLRNVMNSLVDNVYTVYKVQFVSGVSGASSVQVNLGSAIPGQNAAAETLATTDVNAFYVAQDSAATLSTPSTINSVTLSGTAAVITVNSAFTANSVKVIYPVVRASDAGNSLGNLRTKTLTFSASKEFLTSSSAVKNTLVLGNTDIYNVVKVYMATSFVGTWTASVQSSAIDVTDRYLLDDGQRDSYYDLGRLTLMPGFPLPTGSIKVFYDYFSHSNGDFFAKASYSDLTVPYETVPVYKGTNLADALDFRGDISEATGSLVSSSPVRFGTNFIADISYFLGRKEKIFLDRNSTFYNVTGVSDINPDFPKIAENNNSINLYDVALKPYTRSSELPDVSIKRFDNKRYTMYDIGRIEKRVTNLEEITSLSLLETATKGLQVRDNLDSTLERYKTGFFVDNFADASNAEEGGDARYSLDNRNRTMNPMVDYYSFPMVEKLNYTVSETTSGELTPAIAARAVDNYTVTGDLLTINYTTSTVLQQILATTSISVAPFLTATFFGKLRIVPDKDIYENVKNVKVVGEVFTNTQAQAIAAYRATRNWRPYTVSVSTTTTFVGQTSTSELVPFCRPNTILLIAKGLKPKTKYYTFFDDIPVERYLTGASKFRFDSIPTLSFDDSRPANKKEYPRWRSLFESLDVKGKIKVLQRNNKWVYKNGWIRTTVNPRDNDLKLPGKATRDSLKTALSIGSSVWYYERNRVVGTGVAVHQEGTNLYLVNARGKLSSAFIRSQSSQTYNFNNSDKYFFYIAVDTKEKKYVTVPKTAADICTQDTNGYLYSDEFGTVVALFDLPDTDTVKFITGKKPVVITDDAENHPDNWTSRADAVYTSEGFNVTITKNYVSTKTFTARPYDPIAQSFKLPTQFENGAFITDVDIYFKAKPTVERAPVQLEIRTCDSTGRPSSTEILPGTEVTKYPDEVDISDDAQTVTKFSFKQPIYLLPSKDYAVVLKSDTKNYRVWIATLGQPDVFTPGSSYTTQATLGSFFKSQDGTLWTEDQFSDMKFKINRAVFNTNNNGATAYFVNQELGNTVLASNPFTFVHGSNRIRVTHKNHGFTSGDTTRLYSAYWAGQYQLNNTTTIQGIPVGEIFGSFVSSTTTEFIANNTDPKLIVSRADLDSYEVTVSSTAYISATATTGITAVTDGGTDIAAHGNVLYHILKPTASTMNFQPTTLSIEGKLLKGFTYDSGESVSGYAHFTRNLNFNADNILDTSCIVLTDTNEFDRVTPLSVTSGGSTEAWKDSFIASLSLTTTTDHVSPVVDLSTFYLDTIQHRIDNPNSANRIGFTLPALGSTSQIMLMSTIATSNTTIGFDGANRAIYTSTEGLFENVVPGRYLRISSSTNLYTTTAILVNSVANNGKTIFVSGTITTAAAGDTVNIHQYDDFTEEGTFVDASGESKFIIRKINLKNPATQIKLIIESCVPSAADFDVYYKVGAVSTDFESLVWNKFVAPFQTTAGATSSYVSIVKSDQRGVYTDVEFTISNFDELQNPIDLEPFTAFQLKIVMRSSNAARIPQFKNLRAIAHA